MRTYVASDWHLGTHSPPEHSRLASAFLKQIFDSNDRVILNGDIYEGLFEPIEQAEAAQPEPLEWMRRLSYAGRLQRVQGNHDTERGEHKVLLDLPVVGKVLIGHGHTADPWQKSFGSVGDAISRRFGKYAVVRGAAALMEKIVVTTVPRQVERIFRQRCLQWVAREGAALGVFGHVHSQYLAPDSRYANAGWMGPERLEYLVFDDTGPHTGSLTLRDTL